jgi:hypothetical protein
VTGYRQHPVLPPPARVTLAPENHGPRCVDGAWWPYTRDLHRELLPLLRVLEPRWGDITRVTVHADMWRPDRRPISFANRTIHMIFSDRAEGRHTICLLSQDPSRCDLLVIPPPTAPDQAEVLLEAAGRARTSHTTHQP